MGRLCKGPRLLPWASPEQRRLACLGERADRRSSRRHQSRADPTAKRPAARVHPAAPTALVAFFPSPHPLSPGRTQAGCGAARRLTGRGCPPPGSPGAPPGSAAPNSCGDRRRAPLHDPFRPLLQPDDPCEQAVSPLRRASGSRIPLPQPRRPRSAGTRSAPPPAAAGVWRGVPGARPHPVEGGKELPFICRFEGTAQNLHAVPSARATAAPADRDDCRLASQMRRAVSRPSPPDISLPGSRMSPRKFCSQSKKRSARPPGQVVPSPPAAGACPLLLPAAAGRGGQLSIAPRRYPERFPLYRALFSPAHPSQNRGTTAPLATSTNPLSVIFRAGLTGSERVHRDITGS